MGALNPDLPVLTPGATLLEKDDEKNSRMNLETPKSGKMPGNLSADLPSLRASSAAAAAGELPTQVITPPPTQVPDLPAVSFGSPHGVTVWEDTHKNDAHRQHSQKRRAHRQHSQRQHSQNRQNMRRSELRATAGWAR